MAKSKNITRACNMVFVPLNELEKTAKEGGYIPVLKQGVSSDAPNLTDREYECLQHLVGGLNVPAIAIEMCLSERRIWSLLEALRNKFEVNTDHWIVSRYYQLGMDSHAVVNSN